MIDVKVEIRCNRCGHRIAFITDTGGGLRCVRNAIRDARRAAEKAAGATVYRKGSTSHHCTYCLRNIMRERGEK